MLISKFLLFCTSSAHFLTKYDVHFVAFMHSTSICKVISLVPSQNQRQTNTFFLSSSEPGQNYLSIRVNSRLIVTCMNESKEIISCRTLELWPVTEENVNMTQMFLWKIIIMKQTLCFHWSQNLFFAIIQKPKEKSHWDFVRGTSLFTYKNTSSLQFSIPTSTLLKENSLVKGKNMGWILFTAANADYCGGSMAGGSVFSQSLSHSHKGVLRALWGFSNE